MKKRFFTFILVFALIIAVAVPVHAAKANSTAYSFNTRICQSFSFNGTKAVCSISASATDTRYAIYATIKLWDDSTCIKTWTKTATGSFSFYDDTVTLIKGKTYTLTADITINGIKQPTVSASATCKYRTPDTTQDKQDAQDEQSEQNTQHEEEEQNSLNIGQENKLTFDESGAVTMSVDTDKLTAFGGDFSVHDDFDTSVSLGYDYSIQTCIDNKWYDLEYSVENVGWKDGQFVTGTGGSLRVDTDDAGIGDDAQFYIPEPDGAIIFNIDWTTIYGKLPAGNYRLVKNYLMYSDTEDTEDTPVYIACEFEIA